MVDAFLVKIPDNGRKNIFRDKQPSNQAALMFLGLKVLKVW